mgnify:CR=1 FL=1
MRPSRTSTRVPGGPAAGSIAPFGYSDLIFSSLWGWAFFAQLPDRYTVLGAVVIAAAGVYVWSRERAEARRAAEPTASDR